MKNFSDLGLHAKVLRGISDLGFTTPTPIQLESIPAGMQGRDVLACAMTGSGKTAAFVLPILHRLEQHDRRAVRALVVTPTRELASQVHEHLQLLGRHTGLTSAVVFGGVKPGPQEQALRRGVDVVVATPGRLLDFLGQGWFGLDGLEILVLDEADRMLDMGFLPDIKRILQRLPSRRQNLLYSATLPRPIVELCRNLLRDPARINVERKSKPAEGISQVVMPVPEHLKRQLLLEMLRREDVGTALVFTRTKHRANRLSEFLTKKKISADRIHGNRSQKQREAALAGFKNGTIRVLVATDIAARGIDVEALPHVVNFDIPGQPEDYIHRVGRTARAERTGVAITLASPKDDAALRDIERSVGHRIEKKKLAGFDYNAKAEGRLEIPIGERIATMRKQRAEDRARSAAKAQRKNGNESRRAPAPEQRNDEARPSRPPRRRRRRRPAASRS